MSLDMGKTAEARQILYGALRDPELRTESSTTNLFLALRMHLSENLREFLSFLPRRPAGIVYTDANAVPDVRSGPAPPTIPRSARTATLPRWPRRSFKMSLPLYLPVPA